MTEAFDFSVALLHLKHGARVARTGWNGKSMWLAMISRWDCGYEDLPPSALPHKLLPWIGMKTADDGFVPWLASQTDLLAADWVLVR